MKILYVTTVGSTMNFFYDLIKELIEEGHEFDIACNENISPVADSFRQLNCGIYKISCLRKPWSFGNVKAIKEIKKLVMEHNYDIVHCHTPIAAMCTRVACRSLRKKNVKVIYTAHGFHFFKGAPLLNWLVYFPIEWVCSFMTDVLVTINNEDYQISEKRLHAKKNIHVPGVGIDVKKYADVSIDLVQKRREINVPEDAVILLSVGELIKRKNHSIVFEILAKLNNPSVHYCLAGRGDLMDDLKAFANTYHIENRIHFLGFRIDIAELCKAADIFVFPSIHEGLPVALMEAIASGLPCVASDIRGNHELVQNGVNGYLCDVRSEEEFRVAIEKLIRDKESMGDLRKINLDIIEPFDITHVNMVMKRIYENVLIS